VQLLTKKIKFREGLLNLHMSIDSTINSEILELWNSGSHKFLDCIFDKTLVGKWIVFKSWYQAMWQYCAFFLFTDCIFKKSCLYL